MSWTVSPMQTPLKGRRSCNSEYETAGEDDDSDTSMYYSIIDTDRTLENKENLLKSSSKSAKRSTKKASAAGTPLLRKTLQKKLFDVQATLAPQQKDNKTDSQNDNGHQEEAAAGSEPLNTKNETENSIANEHMDDVCEITVVEMDASAQVIAVQPVANKGKSVSFQNANVDTIASDFFELNKKSQKAQTLSKGEMMEHKRLSVYITKKTVKTPNANASVRNSRQQLAIEAKTAPAKSGRTSAYKRSSMYQPRRSSGRRSIEKMIVAKANKTLLQTESVFVADSLATTSTAEKPHLSDSTEIKESSAPVPPYEAAETQELIRPSTSVQHSTFDDNRKGPVKNNPVKVIDQLNKKTAKSSAHKGIASLKPPRISVAPARKSIAPARKSIAPVRKSNVPHLPIFSTSSSSSAAIRTQRRQTKNYLNTVKLNATSAESETAKSILPSRIAPANKDVKSSMVANVPATSASAAIKSALPPSMASTKGSAKNSTHLTASTSSTNKATDGLARPVNVRRTVYGSETGDFKCQQCKKTFGNEFQLKVHISNFHNLGKKTTQSVVPSIESNVFQCRFCDKKFDKTFALKKHMEENCTKIQPATRKRMFADAYKSSEAAGKKQNSITKAPLRSSASALANSARFTRLLTDLINESRSNGDGQRNTMTAEETKLRLSNMSLGHCGVYRTPTKSIKCNICNAVFMNVVLYAEHSLLHEQGK